MRGFSPVLVTAAVLVASCGGRGEDAGRSDRGRAQAPAQSTPIPLDPATPTQATVPDFPEGTRSLELTRTVGVRLEPGDSAKRIGTVAVDTRVAWVRTAKAKGCQKPWIEIKPRGWICADYVRTSTRLP